MTDVSYNYEKAKQVPPLRLQPPEADGTYRMMQEDVDRVQEFHKCIECFLCQNVCHVIRDHEENKKQFAGPRFFIKIAGLEMHPLDTRDRSEFVRAAGGRRALQHHQVLHRGLPRAHPHHRQRHHPDEGAGGRRLRPRRVGGAQAPGPKKASP